LPPSPDYAAYARFGDVAEFLGYELVATELNTTQPVGLTLYWRALEGASAADYLVFTHLLSPDLSRVIAQHDGVPAAGSRPTAGWAPGEIIVDYHELTFYEPDYVGTGQLSIGLYILDGERVVIEGVGDNLVLPTTISIVAP
jgi:hypothetical protein